LIALCGIHINPFLVSTKEVSNPIPYAVPIATAVASLVIGLPILQITSLVMLTIITLLASDVYTRAMKLTFANISDQHKEDTTLEN
jgi:hypothetical protein